MGKNPFFSKKEYEYRTHLIIHKLYFFLTNGQTIVDYHFQESKGLLCLDIKVYQQLKHWTFVQLDTMVLNIGETNILLFK